MLIHFFNEIISFVYDGIIEEDELKTIKYIVSGKYEEDKYIEEQEKKIRAEEQARKKKEEVINNIKHKTKDISMDVVNKTTNKVNEIKTIVNSNLNKKVSANEQLICECGYEFDVDDTFCTNCGKN